MAKNWLGEKILHLAIVLFILALRLIPQIAVNSFHNFYENLFTEPNKEGERVSD
jgi:hypothetical protein